MSLRLASLAPALLLVIAASVAPAAAQPGRPPLPPEIAKIYADKPVVELVTMGVGSLMWERHGHIALCVRYADPNQDACYNYGIGDFHHPVQMAWGFFRAANSFWVGKMRPRDMLSIYQYADRTIWVQPLPLTSAQEQVVIAKLEFDILEDNKHYSYDHFWDNCTTRVRDVLDAATDGALSSMTNKTDGRTYRDLAREGFLGMRIALLITDVAMARVTDQVPTYWERMFLPDYLREAVIDRWGIQPITLYERKGPPALKEIEKRLTDPNLSAAERAKLQRAYADLENKPSGRILFTLVVLLLTAPAWATRLWGRFQRTGLAVALAPALLLGTVLWGLALISPLPYVRWNESCLCLLPLDALLLFLPPVRRRQYARGRVAMLGLVAVLLVIDVLKAPIWPVWLWALVPVAVVGWWPDRAAAASPASASEEKRAKSG